MKKILAAALALCMTMGAAALAEGTFRVGGLFWRQRQCERPCAYQSPPGRPGRAGCI